MRQNSSKKGTDESMSWSNFTGYCADAQVATLQTVNKESQENLFDTDFHYLQKEVKKELIRRNFSSDPLVLNVYNAELLNISLPVSFSLCFELPLERMKLKSFGNLQEPRFRYLSLFKHKQCFSMTTVRLLVT